MFLAKRNCCYQSGPSIHEHKAQSHSHSHIPTRARLPVNARDGEGEAGVAPDQRLGVEEHGHALVPDEPEDALEGHLGLLRPAREAQHQGGEHEVDAAWRVARGVGFVSCHVMSCKPPCCWWAVVTQRQQRARNVHVDLDRPQRRLELHLEQVGAGAHDVVEGQAQAAGDDGGRGGEAELVCVWMMWRRVKGLVPVGRGWVGRSIGRLISHIDDFDLLAADRMIDSSSQPVSLMKHEQTNQSINQSVHPSPYLDGLAQIVDRLPHHQQQGQVAHGRDHLVARRPLPQLLERLLWMV